MKPMSVVNFQLLRKMAIIKLIEKKGKDKMYIKNWRPISLLNVDVKIASKAIAKRLETVLPLISHENPMLRADQSLIAPE